MNRIKAKNSGRLFPKSLLATSSEIELKKIRQRLEKLAVMAGYLAAELGILLQGLKRNKK